MTATTQQQLGAILAERLGIEVIGHEGHDIKAGCIACKSSDAMRIHEDTGVGFCHSCQTKWSAFDLTEQILGSRGNAMKLLIEVGLRTDSGRHSRNGSAVDPLELIARQKRVSPESFKAFGAKVVGRAIEFPCFGPDGQQCTTFTLKADGAKGKFARSEPAGLFCPHDENGVRLPQPGEIWHLVEGVKDAAAMHGLGFNAVGLNTSAFAVKFVRLLRDVHVLIIGDRDQPGEDGAAKTAARSHGVASSVRVVTLPGEFRAKGGVDVRDVLQLKDGEALLRAAIGDAKLWKPPVDESKRPIIQRLAEDICARNHFAQDAGGKLYLYAHGVYVDRGAQYVGREVKRLMEEWKPAKDKWSSRLASEVVEYVRVDAPELWSRPPRNVVNVENGLLRIADRVLLPHSPKHLSVCQLPVEYDPAATCPVIDRFTEEVFPSDAAGLAFEIIANLMVPDTSIQKAILLLGDGGNGKSTWLTMVRAFLGRANVSAITLHELESNRFASSRLLGMLANICADLPANDLSGTSTFKAITGGDMLMAEYKFRASFDFEPFCRLVFSANQPPRSGDSSQAFFDRWVVVPFDRRFRGEGGERQRAELDAALSSPAELSGLLNKTLPALERLRETGRFSDPPSVKKAHAEFQTATDPLGVWLDRYTVDDPQAVLPCHVLRAAYGAHCEQKGRPAPQKTPFGLALKRLRPDVTSKQRTINGRYQWCYLGMTMAQEAAQETFEESTDYTDYT